MGPASAAELPAAVPAGPLDGLEGDVEGAEAGPVDLPLWQPTVRERVGEAWQSRQIALGLARSSIPTYDGRLLGRTWIFITPVMQVFGFGLIFGGIFNAKVPNGVPYLIFLVFGMLAFNLLSITLLYETKATKYVRPLTRGLVFPLLLIPFAVLGRVVQHLAIYLTIAAGLLIYYLATTGHFYLQVGTRFLIGCAGVALCVGYGIALGLFTSVMWPRAKDVRYLERYVLQLWMILTPIFYSYSALPHSYQVLAQLNPLTSILGMVQYGFVDAGMLLPYGILWSVAVLAALLGSGVWFFNRYATRWIGIHTPRAGADDDDDDDF
jgi:lipopolysaccharide transport system permease protein